MSRSSLSKSTPTTIRACLAWYWCARSRDRRLHAPDPGHQHQQASRRRPHADARLDAGTPRGLLDQTARAQ